MAGSEDARHAPSMPEKKDGLDRIMDAVEDIQQEQKRSSANLEAVKQSVEVLRDRVSASERRIGVVERSDQKHVESIRQGSEADAKIQSDQAAMTIALQASTATANKALATAQRIESGQLALRVETHSQTKMLEKKPVATTAAALVNLAIGLVYLFLEALKHFGH